MDEIRAAAVAPVVNIAMLPNYDSVWTELFGQRNFTIPWCDARTSDGHIGDYEGSITMEEIDRAMIGDDGIDPISFWKFPTAPKELFDLAHKQEKRVLDDRVMAWEDRCFVERYDSEEDDCLVLPVLNVEEVSFGEDAFRED